MRYKHAMTARGNREWNKPLAYKTARIFRGRFGEWFEASGMTIKEAAAALGVSFSVISQWHRGQRFPSVRNMDRIAELSGKPIGWFFTPPRKRKGK